MNSVDWLEKIIYCKDNEVFVEPIGHMIDNLLIKFPSNIEKIEENRTEYLSLQDSNYLIPSCDENGYTDWYKIEAITKHLPVGDLVKVTTKSGRSVTATQSKSFLVWDNKDEKFIATEGSKLQIGDILPTTRKLLQFSHQNYVELENKKILLDHNFGYIIGFYLSEGWSTNSFVAFDNNPSDSKIYKFKSWCDENSIDFHLPTFNLITKTITLYSPTLASIIKKNCNTGFLKIIPNFVYTAPLEFIKGLIEGYCSTTSTFIDKYDYVEISSISNYLIDGISYLLSYFNIFGNIHLEKRKLIIKNYDRKKFFKEFISYIYFEQEQEKDDLEKKDVYFDEVTSIEYVRGSTEFVYDLTVEKTRNFQLFNGINVRDTFHKAGQSEKSVTIGVPRFQELLNATKNPKSVNCKIYFFENNKNIKDLRNFITHNFVTLRLTDICESIDLNLNKEKEDWYDLFKILYNNNFENHENCLSLKFNIKALHKYRINLFQIAERIEKEYDDLYCVFSPDELARMDVFVDISKIKFTEKQLLFVTEENANEIYLDEVVQPILEKLILFGIEGIENVYYTYEHNSKTNEDEWFIETDGSNFRQLLGMDMIDMTRLQSNNVWDIYENLGIEASRQFLIDELESIMEGINICHVKLLVEKMTYSGTISSISRYTLRKDESGPLSKASFEESVEHMIKSGFAGDVEKTRGVSASIMLGKRAIMGTGFMDLKNNIKNLPKL